MAKLAVCVAALVLLVALVESSKFVVSSFRLLIYFQHKWVGGDTLQVVRVLTYLSLLVLHFALCC